MARSRIEQPEPAAPLPTVPSVEAWRAMTPDQRIDFQIRVLDALSDPVAAMSEGRPHKRAKSRALDALNLHFRSTGRVVYLAEEMAVLYPEEKPFTPDLLAVLNVQEAEDDDRMAWVVADEGKGLDLVIEVLDKGNRNKDLVENVERYAQLGIPEYFVYDHDRQAIHGYRLAATMGDAVTMGDPERVPPPGAVAMEHPQRVRGAGRYQRVVPQLGHYRSNVLGLDLAILGGSLRFLSGEAELPGSGDLIRRLSTMMASLTTKAETAEARAEAALAAGAHALLLVLELRGIAVSDEERDRILAETDPHRLDRWVKRAASASSVSEVLADPPHG